MIVRSIVQLSDRIDGCQTAICGPRTNRIRDETLRRLPHQDHRGTAEKGPRQGSHATSPRRPGSERPRRGTSAGATPNDFRLGQLPIGLSRASAAHHGLGNTGTRHHRRCQSHPPAHPSPGSRRRRDQAGFCRAEIAIGHNEPNIAANCNQPKYPSVRSRFTTLCTRKNRNPGCAHRPPAAPPVVQAANWSTYFLSMPPAGGAADTGGGDAPIRVNRLQRRAHHPAGKTIPRHIPAGRLIQPPVIGNINSPCFLVIHHLNDAESGRWDRRRE